jgi:hypothetical protein
MAVMLQSEEVNIVNADWPTTQDQNESGVIGYVQSRPNFFVADMNYCIAQMLGSAKVDAGAGGEKPQLRIVEHRMVDDSFHVIHSQDLNDTNDKYTVMSAVSSAGAMAAGYNEYILEMRLNGAEECRVRGITAAVIEILL